MEEECAEGFYIVCEAIFLGGWKRNVRVLKGIRLRNAKMKRGRSAMKENTLDQGFGTYV